jgi:hypothetical protein
VNVLIIPVESLADQTFSLEDSDGTQYHWNASQAKRLTVDNEVADFVITADLTVEQLKKQYVDLDEEYALSTNLEDPILFVPFKHEAQLIDGFHRLLKAIKTGVKTLPCKVLTEAQSCECLIMVLPKGHGIEWGQHDAD